MDVFPHLPGESTESKNVSQQNMSISEQSWFDPNSLCLTDEPKDSTSDYSKTSEDNSWSGGEPSEVPKKNRRKADPTSPGSSDSVPSPNNEPNDAHAYTADQEGPATPKMEKKTEHDMTLGMRDNEGTLTSVGSAGHPTDCTECQFFFFSRTGCKNGQDCKFCHAFHPRSKDKKNRRLQRRLAENRCPEAENPSPDVAAVVPHVVPPPTQPKHKVSKEKDVHPVGIPKLDPKGIVGKFRLTYPPQNCDPSGKLMFIFVMGQSVHVPCEFQGASGNPSGSLSFTVSPPLPRGLQLDEKTGDISGTVHSDRADELGAVSEHTVKASVTVVADGLSITLGSVVLCEAKLTVRVVDLKAL